MNDHQLIKKINSMPSFRKSSEDDIALMISSGSSVSFKKNSCVYREDEPSCYFYIIVSGKCVISKFTDKASERVFAVLSDGDVFGVPEMLLEKYSVSVKCSRDTDLIRISKEIFFSKLIHNINLSLCFMHLMSSNLALMQNAIVLETAEKRITAYLNWLCRHHGKKTTKGIVIERKISNQAIASFLSVTREYVFKVLHQLQTEQILEIGENSFLIKNPIKLHERADMIDSYYIGYHYSSK